MRVRVIVLTIACVLASAGAAAAQTVEVAKPLVVPEASHLDLSPPSMRAPDRRSNYLTRIETLREKVTRTTAQDGGQLTFDHATSLQRELDRLNRVYGVRAD